MRQQRRQTEAGKTQRAARKLLLLQLERSRLAAIQQQRQIAEGTAFTSRSRPLGAGAAGSSSGAVATPDTAYSGTISNVTFVSGYASSEIQKYSGDVIYVDEECFIRVGDVKGFFSVADNGWFANNGIIVGSKMTEDGLISCDCTYDLSRIKDLITFEKKI